MPGGKLPACSMPSAASVSAVAPETLQRPVPATYVIPAGSASMNWTLVAPELPELVYERVTVIGAAEGDGPVFTESDLVAVITDEATVVVSVFVTAGLPDVSLTDGRIVPVEARAAPAGTVPATTKRNTPPAGIGPVVV